MTTPAAPPGTAPGFPDPQAFARAHAQLRADRSIQFDFPWAKTEQNPPPAWLLRLFRAIGRAIEWIGPGGWKTIFWVLIALIVTVLVVALVPPLRAWALRRIRRGRASAAEPPRWTPEAGVARQLLDEADALAAEGAYDAAVRLILHRSIADIQRWRGDLVRPALTSRDIAQVEALPPTARGLFAELVALVERSLFAGRALSVDDWHRARADYAGFALGR